MLKFITGAVVGFCICLILAITVSPAKLTRAKQTVTAGAAATQEKLIEVKYETCKEDFLAETHCYQMASQANCDTMIQQKCGDADATAKSITKPRPPQ